LKVFRLMHVDRDERSATGVLQQQRSCRFVHDDKGERSPTWELQHLKVWSLLHADKGERSATWVPTQSSDLRLLRSAMLNRSSVVLGSCLLCMLLAPVLITLLSSRQESLSGPLSETRKQISVRTWLGRSRR
jgi:hypothetical protein